MEQARAIFDELDIEHGQFWKMGIGGRHGFGYFKNSGSYGN